MRPLESAEGRPFSGDRMAAESTRRIDRHLLLWVSLSQ
jgi:hypothetical protein